VAVHVDESEKKPYVLIVSLDSTLGQKLYKLYMYQIFIEKFGVIRSIVIIHIRPSFTSDSRILDSRSME